MAHSIITVATMKGGSGKSTLASCLAVHWQLKGRRSAIIDADPQSTITRLAAREKALGGVPVIEDATDDAYKTAQRLVGEYDTIIIDTPGFRSQATLGLPRRHRFRPGSGQALAVRRRSHAGHAERPHQRRQRTAAGVPLRPHPDHARLRHRQTHPLRACRGRLPGARQRDDKPRRLCRGRALGRNAEHDGQERSGRPRNRGDRRRGRANLRQHGTGQTGSKRMNKKKFPKAVLRTADADARGRRASAAPARSDNVIEMMPKSDPACRRIRVGASPPIPPRRFGDGRRSRSSSAMPTIRRSAAPFRCRSQTRRRSRRCWCGWSNR